jgi:hypothetical protein
MSQLNATTVDQIPFLRDTICWKMGLRTLFTSDSSSHVPHIATSKHIPSRLLGDSDVLLYLNISQPLHQPTSPVQGQDTYSGVPAEEEPVPAKSTS